MTLYYSRTYSLLKTVLVILLVSTPLLKAQIYSVRDTLICSSKFTYALSKNLVNEPIGDVIASVGKSFIGTMYEEHTLEREGAEELVINLSALDCTTFLENSLAIARCIKEHKISFENFEAELTKIRYREGEIDQYPSRLHYFSDWIFDNEKKSIVKNISETIGGKPIRFNVDFMSTHPSSYLELREHRGFIRDISNQEKIISNREYYFIPKENIAGIEKKIHNGDLVAITSGIKGLDINHVGIAVRMDDGRIHLLHSPNVGSKVQISELPLADYLAKIKKDTGIIVLQVIEPQ